MRNKNLQRINALTLSAMLVALSVTIAYICKIVPILNLGTGLRVTFENLPIILAGVMYGPIVGACVGAASDIISSLLTAQDISLLITFGAMTIGAIAGLCSRILSSKSMMIRFVVAEIFSQIVGSVIIKTIALQIRFRFGPILFFRIPIYIAIIIVECILFSALYRSSPLKKMIDKSAAEKKHELY